MAAGQVRPARVPPEFLDAYDEVLAQWPVPAEAIRIPTRFGATRVNACGPAQAPPLLLLHGGGATSTVWFANVADLAAAHRVYAPDLMGHAGRSVAEGAPIDTAEDMVEWLGAVLDGLGLTATDVVGHSYGGWLALSHALRAPDRVRKLALLDPTRCFTGYRPQYLARSLPLLLRPSPQRVRGFLAWESGGARFDPRWLALAGLAARYPAARVAGGRQPDPRRVRSLLAPTLILLAERSRAHDIRRVEAVARAQIGDLRVATVPDASHHTMPSMPAAAINRHLVDFLA
jgi:pimeloyl-ACP methyl ester carboxylesterase